MRVRNKQIADILHISQEEAAYVYPFLVLPIKPAEWMTVELNSKSIDVTGHGKGVERIDSVQGRKHEAGRSVVLVELSGGNEEFRGDVESGKSNRLASLSIRFSKHPIGLYSIRFCCPKETTRIIICTTPAFTPAIRPFISCPPATATAKRRSRREQIASFCPLIKAK